MHPAPIVLFVYNRPRHTRQTIEALQKNELAKESQIFIYSDAAKDERSEERVNEVREYIKKIDGFKEITIIEREKNKGLAGSIIEGVTKIVNEYGKIIVLEDDIVTNPYFLRFMNEALEFYEHEKKVWHISGWNYPIDGREIGDVFLWRLMNCWGWATWRDRWQYFQKDTEKFIKTFTKEDIYRFNLDGSHDFWGQILANRKGEIDTWAIYWYATIFEHNGLCLNSVRSYVTNIGLDGSGIHCGIDENFGSSTSNVVVGNFTSDIVENNLAVAKIRQFFKNQQKPFLIRVINKAYRTFFKKNLVS